VIVPTSATIRTWTPTTVDYAALGYPEGTPDPLQTLVEESLAQLRRFTGWALADVAVEDEPLFRRAAWMLTYLAAAEVTEDRLDTLADFDLLKSFGAGNYNETRRDLGELAKARMLVPWPSLNTLLWDLMTDEARDKWEDYFGTDRPAFELNFESSLMTGEVDLDPYDPWA
jgi:hypothetical protein